MVEKYIKAVNLDSQDGGDRARKLLKKHNFSQSELREMYSQLGGQEMVYLVFWQYGYDREFSKEFMVEMFGHADKKMRESIDECLAGSLGDYKCDLDLNENITVFKYLEELFGMQTFLKNVYTYLKYCNCNSYWTIVRYNDWRDSMQQSLESLLEDVQKLKRI